MSILKKAIIMILVLLIVNLGISNTVFAAAGITKNKPVVLAPPEEKIPVDKVEKKGGKTWLWVLLGAVVIGGGVAAMAGGTSSSSSSSDNPAPAPSGTTGDVTVTW